MRGGQRPPAALERAPATPEPSARRRLRQRLGASLARTLARLRAPGLATLGQALGGLRLRLRRRAAVSPRTVAAFVGHLHVLLQSGTPLARSLDILTRQEEHPGFREALSAVARAVRGGLSLSQAAALHPQVFPAYALALLRVGEVTGTLHQSLAELSRLMDRDSELRGRLNRAVQYPLFVLATTAGLTFCLFRWVLPNVLGALSGDLEVPLLSRLLILSANAANQPVLLGFGAVVLVLGARILGSYLRTKPGRSALARRLNDLPMAGQLASQVAQVRAARCVAVQVRAGVRTAPALVLAAEVCGDPLWEERLRKTVEYVRNGCEVHRALEIACRGQASLLVGMARAGEESGSLPQMMDMAADMLETEFNFLLDSAIEVTEPLLVMVAGLVTALVLVGALQAVYASLQAV